ncbi:peptidoglycan DD-metalloendopeptidase family protein [Paludibacterium yongneupense]|uniref:peptidoglycan DD-metalloendopeptidase family protein n=1 Tax=Paludibacterium yongneupense TaxID=400061 RepID=UPI001FE96D20|nr:peptidoglycan DD-metalloendopeptidase family protein [Paludibacterium yongneupense]
MESGAAVSTRTAPPAVRTQADGNAQTAPYQAVAPVRASPLAASATDRHEKTHVVQPGENLFRISLNHGLKYQQVAAWNNMSDTTIKVGQVLRLTPPDGEGQAPVAPAAPAQTAPAAAAAATTTVAPASSADANVKNYPKALKLPYSEEARRSLAAQSEGRSSERTTTAHATTIPATASSPARTTIVLPSPKSKNDSSAPQSGSDDKLNWLWPTDGKVLRGYSDSNKGIDIGGTPGQAVVAAGDGTVVYSGNGLRGYGKLIIIKHNKTYLSAYAHNSQLLVKEGQTVKKGQKIAKMGNTDADQVKLHFEVRRFGIPVDPMQYLESRP